MRTVDLSAHIDETIEDGHPADFPVALRKVYVQQDDGSFQNISDRRSVVRMDTGQPLSIVSSRYALVSHQEILNTIRIAIAPLDLGPVPQGIYVDRGGARLRALFKFPGLEQPVVRNDSICPCLKIQNTYDGTSRISIHIGAFRFVCTNLAVGGGGVFAGGFMSVHSGEIPIDKIAEELVSYLKAFDSIVRLYRLWQDTPWNFRIDAFDRSLFHGLAARHVDQLTNRFLLPANGSVFDAYNTATDYATHQTRSYRTAFDLLHRINHGFQKAFPIHKALPAPQIVGVEIEAQT